MKKRLLFAAALVALGISSCTQDESVKNQSNDAIRFGTYVDRSTKGTVLTNDDPSTAGVTPLKDAAFGILGYYTIDAWATAGATATPNFMYNEQIVWNSIIAANWGYAPVKYWSNVDAQKYSFFAYAPYEASPSDGANKGITLSANNTQNRPTIGFAIKSAPENMIDLVCGQMMDQTKTSDAITFNLKHQLTRVTFDAKTDITTDEGKETGNTYVIVKAVKFVKNDEAAGASQSTGLFASGTYTFGTTSSNSTNTDHAQDGVWSALSAQATDYALTSILVEGSGKLGDAGTGYDKSAGVVVQNGAAATTLFDANEYLFLLPPNGSTGIADTKDIYVEVTYDIVTVDPALVNGYTVSSNNVKTVALTDGTLVQGKAYKFVLEFGLTEVKVSGTVVNWDPEATEPVI